MVKSGIKWQKMAKSEAKSGEKWQKVKRKVAISGTSGKM
jgi:hypothetical protein